jgi:hypothetical protein
LVARWAEAGGTLQAGGRMIALKSDPIWSEISRFGHPWPPFDFGSGMGVRGVSREEAVRLGLLAPDEKVQPQEADFNARLQASVSGLDSEQLDDLAEVFGDQVAFSGGTIQWLPDVISGFFGKARELGKLDMEARNAALEAATPLNLGVCTPETAELVRQASGGVVDLSGWRLEMTLRQVYHAVLGHGEPGAIRPGSGAPAGKAPVTEADLRAAPLIWRMADTYKPGVKEYLRHPPRPAGWPPGIQLRSNIAGTVWVGEYVLDMNSKTLTFGSAWH